MFCSRTLYRAADEDRTRDIEIKSATPGVLFWDIGKQNIPRCDAAKPSGLVRLLTGFSSKNEIKMKKKITPRTHKDVSGLIQLIRMGKRIRHKWVNMK